MGLDKFRGGRCHAVLGTRSLGRVTEQCVLSAGAGGSAEALQKENAEMAAFLHFNL